MRADTKCKLLFRRFVAFKTGRLDISQIDVHIIEDLCIRFWTVENTVARCNGMFKTRLDFVVFICDNYEQWVDDDMSITTHEIVNA